MIGAGKGYPMSINMSLHMMSDIVAINSPSHSITQQINGKTGSAALALGTQEMTKDFIVNIEVSQPHEPRVCLELNDDGDLAAMVTLFPHFQFRDVPAELVFVVDRSGSMGGSRIKHAQEVLQLFMRSLPQDCYFNIVGFGSRHTSLFPNSVKYNDDTLRSATTHISGMDANLGGTELVAPLTSVFTSPPIRGYPRQVFVLTDGQVSNTERVIQLVEAHHNANRVFTLGLGNQVSHHLVEGMARAGKGTAQFVSEGSDMAAKVMKQLKEAIQPALENVKVDWGGKVEGSSSSSPAPSAPQGSIVMSLLGYTSPQASSPPEPRVEVHQAPYRVPPVFDSQHFVIYAMYSENKPPTSVKITAQSPDGPLVVELPVDPTKAIRGKLIHTLAARSMIRDLEEGRSWMTELGYDVKSARVKEEIVRLGTKYQLTSLHTSFIAIEERTGNHFDCWFDHYQVPEPVHHHQPVHLRKSLMCASSFGQSSCAPSQKRRRERKMKSAAVPEMVQSCSVSSLGSTKKKSRCEAASPLDAAMGDLMKIREEMDVCLDSVDQQCSSLGSARVEKQKQPSIMSIAMEQSVNGSFRLNEQTMHLISLSKKTLQGAYDNMKISKIVSGEEGGRIIATAVVIAFVEMHYGGERDIWERFIGKARGFLEGVLRGRGGESVEEVICVAGRLV